MAGERWAGLAVEPIAWRFKIGRLSTPGVFWQPPLASFDGIWLREVRYPAQARSGQTITASLTYEMIRPNGKTGIAFVHALDAAGHPIAQDDHEPNGGGYPTDFWSVGECARETFTLRLPSEVQGPVRLVGGFYDLQGARFPTGTPDDLVLLGTVDVGE